MNSRRKGKNGELELAEFLRAHGFEARRGQQFSGAPGSPDIVSDLPGCHIECKRVEVGNPYAWLAQARRDCGEKIPVVMHRRNGEDWLAILPLEDFVRLLHKEP